MNLIGDVACSSRNAHWFVVRADGDIRIRAISSLTRVLLACTPRVIMILHESGSMTQGPAKVRPAARPCTQLTCEPRHENQTSHPMTIGPCNLCLSLLDSPMQ